MAGYNLPENITTGNTGHVGHTNSVHDIINKFDKDVTPNSGDPLVWNGTIYGPPVFSVVGDGTADNSTPFSTQYASVAAAVDTGQTAYFGANGRGKKIIQLPAGTFKVTTPGALMSDLGIGRSAGLTIRGAGRHMTNIVFSPGTANQYLMDNNDDWLHVTFEDMTFHSTVSTASFMKSTSSGGAQDYVFNRVNWSGTWKYGVDLQGTNTNSEMSWYHCEFNGDWTAFLFSGASGTSDQFLNYNFFSCQIEYSAGNFVDMAKGGNINVWGGSLIHEGAGGAAQIFFALRGGDHSSGVQRLMVQGVRVEHRHLLSQLIYCEWKRGNVTFESCDTETYQTIISTPENLVQAYFPVNNEGGPIVVWDSCTLMGKHKYGYTSNNFSSPRRVTYRSCETVTFDDAHSFITNDATDATANSGGTWPIRFENCRGKNVDARPFDCTINWELAQHAKPQQHRVAMQNARGSLPVDTATLDVWLPLGAVITEVRFYKASGGSSASTTFTYPLKTSEGTPTTIATGVGTGAAWSTGFTHQTPNLWFVCDSDAKRQLVIAPTNITQEHSSSVCVVSYIA